MTMGHNSGFSPGLLPVYFLCLVLIYPIFAADDRLIVDHEKTSLGKNATLTCKTDLINNMNLTWEFEGKQINSSKRIIISENSGSEFKTSTLSIPVTSKVDHGNYSCVGTYLESNKTFNVKSPQQFLDLTFPGRFVENPKPYEEVIAAGDNNTNSVNLTCEFEMYYDPAFVEWQHKDPDTVKESFTRKNATHISSTHTIPKASYPKHDGVHTCIAYDNVTSEYVNGSVKLIVYGDPTVELDHVLGIGPDKIFLNWTVDPANSEVKNYYPWVNETQIGKLDNNSKSYIIHEKLQPNTNYVVRLEVNTKHGTNTKQTKQGTAQKNATTLVKEPLFIPNISINGFSATSVTIGWHAPPHEIAPFIHYYILEAWDKDKNVTRTAYHSRDSRNLPYMFDNLEPHRTYMFKAQACSEYTKKCGNWSEPMAAATMDGTPGRPSNVLHNCSASLMFLSWEPPTDRNAEIKGYSLELTGYSEYTDKNGQPKKDTWGPLSRSKSNDSFSARLMFRFDDLQPNTHYTARLSAMTRSRRRGEEATVNCTTAPALPDHPPRPRWRKILEDDKYLFKMFLAKSSERNGPLCCYRVHVVRLPPHVDVKSLKPQDQIENIDYDEAHGSQPPLGAYVADIFTNSNFPKDNELVLGDGNELFNRSALLARGGCSRCLLRPRRAAPHPAHPAPPPAMAANIPTTTEDDLIDGTDEPTRERRAIEDYGSMPMMMDSVKPLTGPDEVKVKDGPLDSEANYTVFVELIPFVAEGKEPLPVMFSEYLNQLKPAPSPVAPAPATPLEIALQATCAIAALVLLGMIVFCVLQTRRSRKLPPHAHLEMGRLPPVFRFFWPTLGGRSAYVPTTPPDMPPVAREDLPAAYAERHADCDLGFQKEFELLQMLSECLPDRTTHASEARENQPKNRYPDIKAYDQTRVKLSQIDGITGSDYINANYVMGYKDPMSESNQERKKFICAQGPTDTTVNDFWRMIWEHGLELIVMLTNLEEYSKVKCSKYWPDDARGRAFGTVSVRMVQETRYSDYIVRELKISKVPTNAEGQPIVENNGVAKRNGDIGKQDSLEASAPTSPRETPTERTVKQYHFLMWKDFAAPEHPHCILKFIKRVNAAWSSMLGRPVVVHCSAGVGRTGTLVALDCLLDQLAATGCVAVFNTVAELRRQRNFLVQSQKQYVFVYRALVEFAHYGDTEIPASRLKSSIDRLRNTPEGADKCLMEHEFEKMINSPISEPVKSCAAAQAEEVRTKNRSNECLPYDRNRVMLSPIPGRDYSTYINASFIEAYDNSEGFIITQDPLPNTIFDFWRMVSEQSVTTIVMLSELGEGKCPRYWDDGTAQYEHLTVQYDESECCPYYTRRQFRLTNTKTGHTSSVRQLQYQGWPTAAGHVPEVTRGLGELCDAAPLPPHCPPLLVHCSTGTERSALFVALCILTTALRTERRVDVQAVARKVRSQRARTIDTVLQYEFLHRAILNYAELHNLLEDS